ncbi:MAG: site-2 protease family protein [Cyanobacteria bacterium RI_101]|nr:site-2 protease family protein [Cyanobacteria bacterium RI_101]
MTPPTPFTWAALGLLGLAGVFFSWSYRRYRPYGRAGVLTWLQSLVLMTPWFISLTVFALGLRLNLAVILALSIGSFGGYIYLGKLIRREEAALPLPKGQPLPTAPVQEPEEPDLLPIPEEDLQKIRGIFGIDTFFATETIPYQEGAIFRGNLRAEADLAFAQLSQKLTASCGETYRLFLVEGAEDRPVVVILPRRNDPQPMTWPQKNLALVLLVATIATTLEASAALLGFDFFSEWRRFPEVLPWALAVAAILAAHEIGHRLLAQKYQIRLSWPFFLPTWQIGSFGAITRFESLLPHRAALFDISLAGPALGGLVSLLFLAIGLVLSHPGAGLQIPGQYFQASILVGLLAKSILGAELEQSVIAIHPLVILGWLGLVINALNLLPAGQLDGGRIVQAIYGRKIARRATVGTLIILGIVALVNTVNSLPLYWAVVILFLQRELERPSLNELTEPDDARAGWGLFALFLMLMTLIPLSPGLALRLGIGG